MYVYVYFFFYLSGDHRDLHVLTHSFPPRRSSDLRRVRALDCEAPIAVTHATFVASITFFLCLTLAWGLGLSGLPSLLTGSGIFSALILAWHYIFWRNDLQPELGGEGD